MSLKAPGARKKPDPEESKLRCQRCCNLLVTCTFSAAVGGFVVAMYLGAFSSSDLTELPDWLQALTSVLALGVSALAVLLVYFTLKETGKTLNITRKMALDQERIGEAQTRPYIFAETIKENDLRDHDGHMHIELRLKNYGNTPATIVNVSFVLNGHRLEDYGDGLGLQVVDTVELGKRRKLIPAIPPTSSEDLFTSFSSELLENQKFGAFFVEVEWDYSDHEKQKKPEHKGDTYLQLLKE